MTIGSALDKLIRPLTCADQSKYEKVCVKGSLTANLFNKCPIPERRINAS